MTGDNSPSHFPSTSFVVVVAMYEGMRNNAQPRDQDNIHNLPTDNSSDSVPPQWPAVVA